jgi:hypothetical protein
MNQVIRSAGLKTYANGAPRTDSVDVCVPSGKYVFTLTDGVGDGIGNGLYELYLDSELMVYGSDFKLGRNPAHDSRGIQFPIVKLNESMRGPIFGLSQLA